MNKDKDRGDNQNSEEEGVFISQAALDKLKADRERRESE